MQLIPAIDILQGQAVRLKQGRYDQVTVYDANPVAVAQRFIDAGATRLHIVDLDGAKEGKPVNHAIVRDILKLGGLEVEVGGGIRDASTFTQWLEHGARYVVMGTAAIRSPELTQELCTQHPNTVIVALDAHQGEVMLEGWQVGSGQQVAAIAKQVAHWGAHAVLYTDIARDGTHEGPNIASTQALQASLPVPVIASGGIGSLDHLRDLSKAKIQAAVCGRALYSGAFSLSQALQTVAETLSERAR